MNDDMQPNNESGYAIILALLMLAILMVAGILASNTSITDMSSVRNTIISSQNASAAESAAMTAVQVLENSKDATQLDPATTTWLWMQDLTKTTDNYSDSTKWGYYDLTLATPKNISAYLNKISPRFGSEGATLRYRVIGWKATSGASLGGYADTLKESYIRGVYYSPSNGIYSVEMGYKKRF